MSKLEFVRSFAAISSKPRFIIASVLLAALVSAIYWHFTGSSSDPTRWSLQDLQSAAQREPNNAAVFYALGRREQESGRIEPANNAFKRAVELEPDHEDATLHYAYTSDSLGDGATALQALRNFLQAHPESTQARFSLAKLYYREGFAPIARTHLRLVVQQWPQSAKSWYLLGVASHSGVTITQAREAFSEAARLEPDNADYLMGLAEAQKSDGLLDESESNYRRALEIAPSNSDLLVKFGEFLISSRPSEEKKREAESLLLRALQVNPANSLAQYQLGRVKMELGETRQAVQHLEAALAEAPENVVGWYVLSQAFGRLGDRARAAAALKLSNQFRRSAENAEDLASQVDDSPRSPLPRLRLARAYIERHSPVLALYHYYVYLQLKPGDKTVRREVQAYEARLKENGQMLRVTMAQALSDTIAVEGGEKKIGDAQVPELSAKVVR